MNSSLGVWYGPIGGYSFRSDRVSWMKDHGYEVVGSYKKEGSAEYVVGDQLCLAGTKYSALFQKRVVDMVKNDGVRFFKWE